MKRPLLWVFAGGVAVFIGGIYLSANRPTPRVTKVFPAAGVKKVVVRAAQAGGLKVLSTGENQIQISGLPVGGAQGYHSPDPFWRETPAHSWGLDFVAQQYGDVLVISADNEIEYIHHHYALENLSIRVPTGVKVSKEVNEPDGEGKPNLKKPA